MKDFLVHRFQKVISKDLLDELICDFYKNCNNTYIGRRFNFNLEHAKKLLVPELKNILPGDWNIDSGNYFETKLPYRLHCDSGKDRTLKLYYNIVIPLKLWHDNYDPSLNKLIVTEQTWIGDAAFFVKGDQAKNEYNICVTEYDQVGNKISGIDNNLLYYCDHLNPKNLEGFSIKSIIDWVPGDIICFPRNYIHTTSNWKRAGVDMKLGLSFFTSL